MTRQPQPPFDQTPPEHADAIAGDDYLDPSMQVHPFAVTSRGCIILAGAIIGTLAGTGASIVGSVLICAYLGVEVPWPW